MFRSNQINWDKVFYSLLAVFVGCFLASFIYNYNLTWIQTDILRIDFSLALQHGTSFSWQDFFDAFTHALNAKEGRMRYFTYFLLHIDEKFRIWLWHYIVPHPGFSLSSWLFNGILAPVFLFKFINNVTKSLKAAGTVVLLYITSTGYLSGLAFLCGRGKPFCAFLTIFCLYLASKIDFNRLINPTATRHRAKDFMHFFLILICILIGFMTDEYSLFIFVSTLTVLYKKHRFSELLRAIKAQWKEGVWNGAIGVTLLYCSTVFILVALVLFIIPYAAKKAGYLFDPASILSRIKLNPNPHTTLKSLLTNNIFQNPFNLTISQMVIDDWHSKSSLVQYLRSAIWVVLISYFGYLYSKLHKEQELLRAFLVSLLLCVIFLSVLHLYHFQILEYSYYYGSSFSIFYALLFGTLFSYDPHPLKVYNRIALVFIVVGSLYNFVVINQDWKDVHTVHNRETFLDEAVQMKGSDTGDVSYQTVKQLWENRYDPSRMMQIKKTLGIQYYWVFQELEYTTSPVIEGQSINPHDYEQLTSRAFKEKKLELNQIKVESKLSERSHEPYHYELADLPAKSKTFQQVIAGLIKFTLSEKTNLGWLALTTCPPGFWDGENTFLQVSNDGTVWITVARLKPPTNSQSTSALFKFTDIQPYSYYRIRFDQTYSLCLQDIQIGN